MRTLRAFGGGQDWPLTGEAQLIIVPAMIGLNLICGIGRQIIS